MNFSLQKSKICFWITRRLPRWVVTYCGYLLFAHGTCGKDYGNTVAGELTMFDALERWEK